MNKSPRLLRLFKGKERVVTENGYVFVKRWRKDQWVVSIYTEESYKNSQNFGKSGTVV